MAEKNVSGKVMDGALIRRLLRYVRPYRKTFFAALTLTILVALLAPIQPLIIRYMLDTAVVSRDIGGVRFFILLLLGVLMLQGIVMYANTYITNWLGQSIIRDIRKEVFQHIMNLRLQFFDKTPIGTLQTRTINDVEVLNDVFTSGLVRILGDMLQLIAILAAMFYTSWKLTLVVLTILPLLLFATYVFKNKVKVAFQQERKAVSELNAFLQEHITGMSIIHIFNREKIESERYDLINRDLRRAFLNSVLYYSIFFPVVEIITALGLVVLVWYGATNVIGGGLTFGILTGFIMYIQMFFRPIRMLADQFNTLQRGMVSAERIFRLLDTKKFISDTGTHTQIPEATKALSIRFEEVSFAYNEPEWVLKDIDLDVKAGDKVALVGATGSGKTTIINLLSRFYEIQKGTIYLNGTDIRELDLSFLRSLTGVVLQDVFLFSGSIHDNITLNNPDISREVVTQAAQRVGAHDFIMQLPDGYDHQLQERGSTLSLGQRQLLAFARVMTYDPRILVLDEATANIDTESEEIIQRAIDTVMAGRTSIIIAHRLSTIQKADKIVVLSKGRIIESGSHKELMKHEGAYFELHQLQFAG